MKSGPGPRPRPRQQPAFLLPFFNPAPLLAGKERKKPRNARPARTSPPSPSSSSDTKTKAVPVPAGCTPVVGPRRLYGKAGAASSAASASSSSSPVLRLAPPTPPPPWNSSDTEKNTSSASSSYTGCRTAKLYGNAGAPSSACITGPSSVPSSSAPSPSRIPTPCNAGSSSSARITGQVIYKLNDRKSYLGDLDTGTMLKFVHQICDQNCICSLVEEDTLTVLQTAAEFHGCKMVPLVSQIVSTIIRIMSSGTGSLHSVGCSKVICTLSRYVVDPLGTEQEKSGIISSLCSPLSGCLTSTNESVSSGSALCVTALIQSNSWQVASHGLINDICLKVSGALEEVHCHTISHLGLVVALLKQNPLTLGPYGRSLIRSGLNILDVSTKECNSQMITSSIQMIHSIMKNLDLSIISSEISSIIQAMEQLQDDSMSEISTPAFHAAETAKKLCRQEECGHVRRTSALEKHGGRNSMKGSYSYSVMDDAEIRDSGSNESLSDDVQSVQRFRDHDSHPSVGQYSVVPGSARARSNGSDKSHRIPCDDSPDTVIPDYPDAVGVLAQSNSVGLFKSLRRSSNLTRTIADPIEDARMQSTPRSCSDSKRDTHTHRLPASPALPQILHSSGQCTNGEVEERNRHWAVQHDNQCDVQIDDTLLQDNLPLSPHTQIAQSSSSSDLKSARKYSATACSSCSSGPQPKRRKLNHNKELAAEHHSLFRCSFDSSKWISFTEYAEQNKALVVKTNTPGSETAHISETASNELKLITRRSYQLLENFNECGLTFAGNLSSNYFVMDKYNVKFDRTAIEAVRKVENESLDEIDDDKHAFVHMIRREIFDMKPLPTDLDTWLFLVDGCDKTIDEMMKYSVNLMDEHQISSTFTSLFDTLLEKEETDPPPYDAVITELAEKILYSNWQQVVNHRSGNTYLRDTCKYRIQKRKKPYPNTPRGLLLMLRNSRQHSLKFKESKFARVVAEHFPNLISDFQLAMHRQKCLSQLKLKYSLG